MTKYPAELYRAWERLSRLRSCPPLDLLQAGGSTVDHHLKGCAYCRDELANLEIYTAVASTLKPGLKQPQKPPPPQAGQIRAVLRSAVDSIEEGGRFFNPPLVLVLTELTGIPDMVRVAQLCDEPALRWEGDICFQEPYEAFFAESWNCYPAFLDKLSQPLGQVSTEVVKAVINEASKPHPDLPIDSPLLPFRRQEVDTGAFFSRDAVARGLEWVAQNDNGSTNVIPFPGKSMGSGSRHAVPKEEPSGNRRVGGMKKWGVLAMAASICFIITNSFMEPVMYNGSPDDTLAALRLVTMHDSTDIVRGEYGFLSKPFPWADSTIIPPLRWKQFAAGQMRARATIYPEALAVLPEPWEFEVTEDSTKNVAYADLGVLAYSLDALCRHTETPEKNAREPMRKLAEKLKKHIKPEDTTALSLIRELLQEQPSCTKLNNDLDEIDLIYR